MERIIIISIYAFSCLCFNTCGKEQYDKFTKLKIEPTSKSISLSEIVDSVQFIVLDESNNSFIRNIKKINFIGEDYLILSSNRLFRYSSSGKLIWEINSLGRGPSEYTSIRDFTVDQENDLIYIYDNKSLKVLVYDSNGKYRFTNNALILASSLAYLNGHLLFFSPSERNKVLDNNSECGLIQTTTNVEYIKNIIRTGTVGNAYLPNVKYFNNINNEELLFIPSTSDTVYMINDDMFMPYKYIDFSYFDITNKLYEIPIRKAKIGSLAATKFIYLESDSHLLLYSLIKQKLVYTFVSKKDNTILCTQQFENDLFQVSLDLAFAIRENEVFYSMSSPFIEEDGGIKFIDSKTNSFGLSKEYEKKIKALSKKLNGNPIIIKLFLKKSFAK